MIGHIIKKILSGERYSVKQFSDRSGVPEEKIRTAFEQLEEDDVLVKVTENQFVLGDVDDDYAIEKIREASAQLKQEIDDRTEVKVSGALVEDQEFKTDKDPSELL